MPFVKFLFNREPSDAEEIQEYLIYEHERARAHERGRFSCAGPSRGRFVPMTRQWQDIAVHQVV